MKYEKTGRIISRTWWEIIAIALFIGVMIGLAIVKSPTCQYEDQAMLSGGVCVAVDDLNVIKQGSAI